MSKAVLLSIRPEWCEKIASGRKTIEVRKTRPNLNTPFKCYIYRTLPKSGDWCEKDGKVIGEFVCDEVETYDDDTIHAFTHEDYSRWNDFDLYRACMHPEDFEHYANDSWLYGWHISELKIYDKPKDLSEFYMPGTLSNEDYLSTIYDGSGDPMRSSYASYLFTRQLRRPPQSWCYVEELT